MKGYLYVEGADDIHSIIHLLIRHGFDFNEKRRPCEIKKPLDWDVSSVMENTLASRDEFSGIENLLASIERAVSLSTGLPVGFILDADLSLPDRWKSVQGQLAKVDVDTPNTPPSEGFVGYSKTYETQVGVWLMPDNKNAGKLENFLQSLIDREDVLLEYAQSTTKIAKKEKGAIFSDNDAIKAELHTWLAWQEEPGKPYGIAITARYFQNHASPEAIAFVAWFKRLYGIEDNSATRTRVIDIGP